MKTLSVRRHTGLVLFTCLAGAALSLGSCAGVTRQQEEGQNFRNCEFQLQSIEQANLGGVDVTNVRSAADLSPGDRARLLGAFAAGSLPLHMRVNLQVTNPNAEVAALNALDYKILLDGNEVATGATTERIAVPGNSTATVTVPVNADVRKAVSGAGGDALGNFALGLADRNRQPTRVTIALRPPVNFLGRSIKSADYVTVDKDVTARQLLHGRDSLAAPRP